MEITTDRAARSLRSRIMSVTPAKPLEFDLEIVCEYQLSTAQALLVKDWLFGHINYKRLQIMREDLGGCYFNCLLNNPEDIQINGNNGWKFTVVCDAGGAWEFPKTTRFFPTNGGVIVINNPSGNNDYTYPDVSFKMNADGDFAIKNQTDDNRLFSFEGLLSNEVVTVNGESKVISSDLGIRRLSNFNKKFLRLKRGQNVLTCTGNVEYLDITIQNFRRLGG